MTKLRMLVAGAVLAVGSTTAAVLPSASEVSAHDACTNFADSGWNYNFHDSCSVHDDCYGQKPYGNSTWGRVQCDNLFRRNMNASCDLRYPGGGTNWAKRQSCKAVANAAFGAVVAAGWYFWD